MSYLRLPQGAYDKLLDKDPKTIQMDICDYVIHLKNQGIIKPRSIEGYLAAIRKFYVMNDVTQLNWAKIHSFTGENEKQIEDRPYTHAEIQKMLQKTTTTTRNRAIILLMCSGGLRVGAIPGLRIRDLEPVDKYGIYRVSVYATSKKSRYITFCSVECRKEIDSYLEWRKRWGEKLEDDSPLFRRGFNTQTDDNDDDEVSNRRRKAKPIHNTNTIRWFVSKLLRDTGIRPVTPTLETEVNRQTHHRFEIMECHGFRKFFETNAFKAGMNNMYIRRLLGQKSGLEDSYLRIPEVELLEGSDRHTGYVDIIDQITINDEHRLRRENQILKVKEKNWEAFRQELDELKEMFTKAKE
jgi:integrase